MKKIVFNIIYTPNTVKYLWRMTTSVLHHSNFNLRIISNNCEDSEIEFLIKKTENNPRLELYLYPENRVAMHHDILNHIYTFDKGHEFFCFMDSDIFLNGNAIENLFKKLNSKSALFSGEPILYTPNLSCDGVDRLQGRHFHARNGQLVGGSYFTIYRRKDLNTVMRKTGLMFDRLDWNDIDPNLKVKLKLLNLEYEKYDTAKLLNIFLAYYGFKTIYAESPDLYHIGGFSAEAPEKELNWLKKILFRLRKKIGRRKSKFSDVGNRRKKIATYYTTLLTALTKDKKVPPLIIMDNEVENKRIEEVTHKLIKIYK